MRGDLATWCRIFAVGPPCEHACPECRALPVRLSDLPKGDPDVTDDPDIEPLGDGDTRPAPAQVGGFDGPAHLVTLGLPDRLRDLLDGMEATHVTVDLTADTPPDQYLLAVVDAASIHDRSVVLVGPLAWGWVCSGQLRDLGEWGRLRAPYVRLVVGRDVHDPQTRDLGFEVYTRLGAVMGLDLDYPGPLAWLRHETQEDDRVED